mgnify:CR=1 FL=1
MANNKKYWSGLDELDGTEAFKEIQAKEFQEQIPVDQFLADERHSSTTTGRRDFLKFMGFSLTAATLAACETPVIKSIPYTNKPAEKIQTHNTTPRLWSFVQTAALRGAIL